MAFPPRVKIGHKWFTLTEDKGLTSVAEVTGVCGADTQEIRIDGDLGDDTRRETVLHELLHGVWNLTLLEKLYSAEQAEQVIYALSPFILGMLQDNPDLVLYLTEDKQNNGRSKQTNGKTRTR